MNIIRFLPALIVFFLCLMACNTDNATQQIEMDQSSLFWFDGDAGDEEDYPPNLDPEAILCIGKGLKVGRCISSKLKSGICLGLLKHHKNVIAIEVPCNVIQQDSVQDSL